MNILLILCISIVLCLLFLLFFFSGLWHKYEENTLVKYLIYGLTIAVIVFMIFLIIINIFVYFTTNKYTSSKNVDGHWEVEEIIDSKKSIYTEKISKSPSKVEVKGSSRKVKEYYNRVRNIFRSKLEIIDREIKKNNEERLRVLDDLGKLGVSIGADSTEVKQKKDILQGKEREINEKIKELKVEKLRLQPKISESVGSLNAKSDESSNHIHPKDPSSRNEGSFGFEDDDSTVEDDDDSTIENPDQKKRSRKKETRFS